MGRHQVPDHPELDEQYLEDILALAEWYTAEKASAPNRYEDLMSYSAHVTNAKDEARRRLATAHGALIERLELGT